MKLFILLLTSALLIATSGAVEAKSLYKYKCYALLEDDTFAVIDVEVKNKAKVQAQKAAVAEGHMYPGAERHSVAQVMECVLRTDEFTDAKAQAADKAKLR
ncbi:TapY2 family type IVa secretion system protein [Pseudoalteromonas sp. SSDWG2]|uniref:TapY2 family type IVa secretion system protein n=1 Tax=Pseudoalteromonas sp. SSDWG2 TaxID=3139391 RepID=UPI003BAD7376